MPFIAEIRSFFDGTILLSGCNVELEVTGEAWPKPLRYARTQNLPAAEHLARRVADRLGIPVEEHTP